MTTDRPWADLPNAKHIDAVLADVKARPEVWVVPVDAMWGTERLIFRDAREAIVLLGRGGIWAASWEAARYTLNVVGATARHAAQDIIRALIAWDSAADLLDLSPDALRVLIDVAAPPVCHQAALLLPWAVVRENRP